MQNSSRALDRISRLLILSCIALAITLIALPIFDSPSPIADSLPLSAVLSVGSELCLALVPLIGIGIDKPVNSAGLHHSFAVITVAVILCAYLVSLIGLKKRRDWGRRAVACLYAANALAMVGTGPARGRTVMAFPLMLPLFILYVFIAFYLSRGRARQLFRAEGS